MLNEYYLVPFGREPGGYLDILGLPPSTPYGTVADQGKKYRLNLRSELRAKRKALASRQEKNEITKEEFEAQDTQLEAEASKREAEFNDLKGVYEAARAQQRELERGGHKSETTGWGEMFRGLDADPARLWEILFQPRPLPRVAEQVLRQVEQRWLNSAAPKDPGGSSDLPSSQYAMGAAKDLALISGLALERDLIRLMWADALWSRLSGTNRDYWQRQVLAWVADIEQAAPRFQWRTANGSNPARHDYPNLSLPRKRVIARLEEGTVETPEQGPGRREDTPEVLDLDKFLAMARDLDMAPDELRDLLFGKGAGDAAQPSP